jgi:hypothetical protein
MTLGCEVHTYVLVVRRRSSMTTVDFAPIDTSAQANACVHLAGLIDNEGNAATAGRASVFRRRIAKTA